MLAKQSQDFTGISFVDVDYPSLIKNKLAMVKNSPDLMKMLGDVQEPSPDDIQLRSERYVALGCDLSNPLQLEESLSKVCDLTTVSICFVAEVSITYMKDKDADRLIRWASKLQDARFVLLEQCLPWGPEHPFAVTMLNHFAKLGTRLRSLKNYPAIEDQKKRFLYHGWATSRASSLWQIWSADEIVTPNERTDLNSMEQFDEWEEFALYGQHYFTLVAETRQGTKPSSETEGKCRMLPTDFLTPPAVKSHWEDYARLNKVQPRSHGVLFEVRSGVLCHHGGHGAQKRLATSDLYSTSPSGLVAGELKPPASIGEKTCHAVTRLGVSDDFLLTGGRLSPDSASADVWLKSAGGWTQLPPLPCGLYRHCTLSLSRNSQAGKPVKNDFDDEYVLIYGGKKGSSHVSDQWFLGSHRDHAEARPFSSWLKLDPQDMFALPLFGASLIHSTTAASSNSIFSGFLAGGMTEDGKVNTKVFAWTVDITTNTIRGGICEDLDSHGLGRVGATIVEGPQNEQEQILYLLGGVAAAEEDPRDYASILEITVPKADDFLQKISVRPFFNQEENRASILHGPLLVGHSAICTAKGTTGQGTPELIVIGGGANCFSFGTYHNKSIWTFSSGELGKRQYFPTSETEHQPPPPPPDVSSQNKNATQSVNPTRIEIVSQNFDFQEIVRSALPKTLRGLDVGTCVSQWSCEYLKSKVGADRQITVHWSEKDVMNFQEKNFEYRKMPFGQFLDSIESGGKHYLRALSSVSIDKPANFWTDYPEIAADFKLPPQLTQYIGGLLPNDQERLHSAVLRLSGPVSMWLHYDVMANVLCQVKGTKRLLLFPPTDVLHLGIQPGHSNSNLNLFDERQWARNAALSRCHAHEVLLQPGDILFIPALWLHTAQPTQGISMAVNVFFRDLDRGYAAGKDAYGNRDIQAYEEGRKQVQKLVSKFDGQPASFKAFYVKRLAQELQGIADGL